MQQSPYRLHVPSLLQVLMSGAGLATAFVAVLACAALGFVISRGDLGPGAQVDVFITLAWVSGILGLAALPSLYLAVRRLITPDRAQPPAAGNFRLASIAMVAWPLVVAAGYAVVKAGAPVLALLPLHTLATILPLWWLVEYCRRGLQGSTAQRGWGAFNFALFVSNPLTMFVELLGGFVALIALVAFLSGRPDLANAVESLSSQLLTLQNDPAGLKELMMPFYSNPTVLLLVLVAVAGVVPLLEELFKPLVVWVMGARKITPSEGFILGAVAGAAFAVQETLMASVSATPETWLTVIIGRAGTGALHVTTAALMGRVIAEVWNGKSWPRAAGIYLLAVALHGLWNGLSILSGFGEFFTASSLLHQAVRVMGQASSVFLALLAGVFLLLLWFSNRQLSRAAVVESVEHSALPSEFAQKAPLEQGLVDGSNSERI